jgi:RHS repeat-associated protein
VRDPVGNVFTTDFDRDTGEFKGLLKSLTKGAKITEYDPSTGQPRLMDDGRGNITELFYNSNGDIQRIRVPNDPDNANRDTVFEYPAGDANRGLPSAVIDRKGYRTEFEWDPAGNPRRIRAVGIQTASGESSEIVMEYDVNGNRTSVTDRRGSTTIFSFDGMDRQSRVTQPGGAYSSTTFDLIGRPEQSRNFNGSITRQVYGTGSTDGGLLARVEAQTPGGGWEDVERYAYFEDGRIASTTDGEGVTRSFEYHPSRIHLVQRIYEAAPVGQNYREFDYNANEQIVRETIGTTGPAPAWPLPSTLYLYDSAARLDTVVNVMNGNWSNPNDPAHIRTRVTYYDDDQIDTVIDPRGKTIKHVYDPLGRLASRRDANNSEWTYRYDANGNLHREGFPGSATYPARTITRNWGLLDLLQSINYDDGVTPTVTYSYDANGNRTGMTDRWVPTPDVPSVSYAYDALNRPISITRHLNGLSSQTLGYSYFPGGQLRSITYPGARTVDYTYDHLDRMKTVTPLWTGGAFTYTWRRNGQLDLLTNPNGTQTDYEYLPSNGRLSRLLTTRSGVTIADQQFTYDPVGNITRILGDLPIAPPADAAITMEPDDANRLDTIAGQVVSNDRAGRSRVIPGPLNATTAWEGMDWLSSYTSGGVATSYRYDGDGIRLSRSSSAGGTTRYLVDPTAELPNVVVENDASNTPQRFYIYGAEGLIASIDASNAVSTYHFSHRGDTLALTNASGNVTESYGYSPYGVTVASNPSSNPFRFIGQHGVMDEGNGLQFMRARYYSASVGRFLSMDQLPGSATDAQTLNRFAYATGEPIMTVDPSGFIHKPIINFASDKMNQGTTYCGVGDGREAQKGSLVCNAALVAGMSNKQIRQEYSCITHDFELGENGAWKFWKPEVRKAHWNLAESSTSIRMKASFTYVALLSETANARLKGAQAVAAGANRAAQKTRGVAVRASDKVGQATASLVSKGYQVRNLRREMRERKLKVKTQKPFGFGGGTSGGGGAKGSW